MSPATPPQRSRWAFLGAFKQKYFFVSTFIFTGGLYYWFGLRPYLRTVRRIEGEALAQEYLKITKFDPTKEQKDCRH